MNCAFVVLAIIFALVTANQDFYISNRFPTIRRQRRDAVGSLDIVTNNVQPIHADVKTELNRAEKPCPQLSDMKPSNIEPGVVFKVTPPKDNYSLRRSSPLTTTLDLVRAISRLITVIFVTISAAIELYPVLISIYDTFYELIY